MLSESLTTGVHHRRDGVNDQLGGGEIGWRFAEPQRRDLEQYEEMVSKDRLGGRGAQVRDLVGFVELGLARWIAHANQRSVSRAARKTGATSKPCTTTSFKQATAPRDVTLSTGTAV